MYGREFNCMKVIDKATYALSTSYLLIRVCVYKMKSVANTFSSV